jgi:hypothetical protein
MKRKVLSLIVSLTVLVGLSTSVFVKASLSETRELNNVVAAVSEDGIINESRRLLEEALREKTFYKYNVAYASISKIQDSGIRDTLLGQLGAIAGIVWTEDVKKFNNMLDNLVKTDGSGEIYDKIQGEVGKSSLTEIDKGYLLTELNSWGRRIVYTNDYSNAVEKVVYAWKMLTTGTDANINSAISEADRAINAVKNKHSREYLAEQLRQIREQTEFTVIEIN